MYACKCNATLADRGKQRSLVDCVSGGLLQYLFSINANSYLRNVSQPYYFQRKEQEQLVLLSFFKRHSPPVKVYLVNMNAFELLSVAR